MVDIFWIKYVGKEHAERLMSISKQYYEIIEDMTWSKYIKHALYWDYENKEVHISKAGYVKQALKQFQDLVPRRQQNSLYSHTLSKYGAKEQFVPDNNVLQPLSKDGKKFLQ